MRRGLLLAGVFGSVLMLASRSVPASAPTTWMADVNPGSVLVSTGGGTSEIDTPFSGRINALAVDLGGPQKVFAASELGGLFETTDGGAHWAHVDAVTMFQVNDVKYVSTKPDVIVAAGDYDGRMPSKGGIWRSVNGGTTWQKTRGSDPTCSSRFIPAGETSAHRIAVASAVGGPPQVFVADDCGIAASRDFGATWSRIDPQSNQGRYWDVQATPLANGKLQLDTCGDAGYFRSADSGLPGTWSAADPLPYFPRSFGTPCRIAIAPGDPSTVFLTGFNSGQLWEATGTAAPWSWMPLDPVTSVGIGRRDHWVQTHAGLDGDPGHFEVYFYGGDLVHETCSIAAMPRCAPAPFSRSWPAWGPGNFGSEQVDADAAEISFDPSRPNGCPLFETNDHGVFATANGCDAQPVFSAVNAGLDPLWVWPGAVTGAVVAGRTNLYFGTQDNGLFSSADTGSIWWWQPGFDVLGLAADISPLQQVAATIKSSSSVWLSGGPQGVSGGGPIVPPPLSPLASSCGALGPFSNGRLINFGPRSYAVVSYGADDCFDHLWVTSDSGQTWSVMGPALPFAPEGDADYIDPAETGPASSPTFYLQDTHGRLFRISGPMDPTAVLTEVDAGFRFGGFAVNPTDPAFLYASEAGAGQMMVSRDAGVSWQPDETLTGLITHNGAFPYRSLLGYSNQMFPLGLIGQPSTIAFDPGSRTIMVGTCTAGIFASFDAGSTWIEIPGSERIPRIAGFFFDQRTGAIYVGSSGRGLWRIDVPGRTGSG